MIDAIVDLASPAVAAAAMPAPDPLGYPLPPWIIQALAYLTLTLHLLAVNFTVGAAILYLWTRLRGGAGQDGIARFLGSSLPLGVSYIITLGIPPLLFLQVLYGQQFYSSSVLIGSFWILVIPAAILAYAGFYYHKIKRATRPRGQTLVVAVCLLLLLYVGYVIVSNLTLSMNPDAWREMYAESPAGAVLHHADGTVGPRFILFLAASPAVAGLALIWRGTFLRKWNHTEEGDRSQRLGLRAALVSPVIWVLAAVAVCMARPDPIVATISSGAPAVALVVIGVVAAAAAVFFAFASLGGQQLTRPLLASLGLFVAVGCLIIFRDLLRLELLRPHFELSSVPVNAQWGMFILFLATLGGGVLLMLALFARVLPRIAAEARRQLDAAKDAGA